ncbi:MAG TPA: hypothetical protein VL651_05515 [Bacteroidia bacterium]|nr:hypothetical protein [Bacteroidia bacterium]
MKKLFAVVSLFLGVYSLSAQSDDTTHYLFKNMKLSYVQFSMGYERINFGKGDGLGAMYYEMFGLAFDNRIAIGLDLDGGNHTYNSFTPTSSYPKTATYLGMGLKIEPLIKPKKLINFSVPLRVGFGMAARWDTTFEADHNMIAGFNSTLLNHQVTEYDYSLMYFSGGVNAFVNLWKSVSLGGGASYRYTCSLGNTLTQQDFSGLSYNVMIRFKFDYRAYNKKMMDRYKQFYQQVPPPSGN